MHYVCIYIVIAKKKKYTVRVRVWIDEDDGPFLGIGRVVLLEKIKETGSITNAAKSIKMSYRQAWQLVEDMNKRSKIPLVEKVLGGRNGSGTKITKAGEEAIKKFYSLEKQVQNFTKKTALKIKF